MEERERAFEREREREELWQQENGGKQEGEKKYKCLEKHMKMNLWGSGSVYWKFGTILLHWNHTIKWSS